MLPLTPFAAELQLASRHAQAARFTDMLAVCQQLMDAHGGNVAALLDVGALLSNFGFMGRANACFEQALRLAPDDLRARVNLANLARDAGDAAGCRRLYAALQQQTPDHPVLRRNALVSLEYDPQVSDAERLAQARAWGTWAVARAGGVRARPALRRLSGRPLRVGYVSADFCQHTVGLFFRSIVQAHDAVRVLPFAYSAGSVHDGVTAAIRAACQFRDVAALDDTALAALVAQDQIDVLVDLSGHTAGSRLTLFALRPAPVMVSWLGYFASTGLACMDAVLLDDWHAPAGAEALFVEPVLRLPGGKFCYQSEDFAPAHVAPLPCLARGHITFGSFNHTAKYNPAVFDLWAQVLAAVPGARLVLKWRSFNDPEFCALVRDGFALRGIDQDRIELRPPSFHADMLRQYADIDIALDPFPFTGGLTSCEALWMGVPVVTRPQSRAVSRQTFAFLSAIGLPELAARDASDYVRIACELAADTARLSALRATLRDRMRASPLMDGVSFILQLENTLIDLYQRIEAKESDTAVTAARTILHVGPGHRDSGARLPAALQGSAWRELRLDIDPANEPDIIGSMLDMTEVHNESVDAVFSAHNIEHVHAHEVLAVLKEFMRVLRPDGFVVVTCPDLQTVCQLIADDKLGDAAYQSPAGAITPLDILCGHGSAVAAGHHYMAHKTGFTLKTLTQSLQAAGFKTTAGKRRLQGLDLWVVASKGPMEEAAMRVLAGKVLPA